jgi:SAM-dependent methyltransferase
MGRSDGMKWFYEVTYKHFTAPWEVGPRDELVTLVENGTLAPCRAIDLGCGTGANAIYLAQHGFTVTGVDFAPAGIDTATRAAAEAGVTVDFIVDDLTDLRQTTGPFDFLLDYGVLDDLRARQRHPYKRNILPLTRPGSRFLLWGFEYPIRWWERLIPFFDRPFADGEIAALFGDQFSIETINRRLDRSTWPPGTVTYLMTRT